MEFSEDLSHLERAEWESFLTRSVANGVARKEAERIAAEALEAGVRLLPAPDSVTAPGGTLVELSADSLRVSTADKRVADWFAARHDGIWPTGWQVDKWTNWLPYEACLSRASTKVRNAIATLDDATMRKAAVSAERLAILKRAVALA